MIGQIRSFDPLKKMISHIFPARGNGERLLTEPSQGTSPFGEDISTISPEDAKELLSKTQEINAVKTTQEGNGEKWVALAYIAADNVFESSGLYTLLQLENVGSSKNMEILAQIKRREIPYGSREPRIDMDGYWGATSRRFYITKGAENPAELKYYVDLETLKRTRKVEITDVKYIGKRREVTVNADEYDIKFHTNTTQSPVINYVDEDNRTPSGLYHTLYRRVAAPLLGFLEENDPTGITHTIRKIYPSLHYAAENEPTGVVHTIHGLASQVSRAKDSASPDTLEDFTQEIKRYDPENSASTILFAVDHGLGLLGLMVDDSKNNFMTIPELRQSLEKTVKERGKKIDILVIDACLMNIVELAHELKDLVSYVVASQDFEYVPGLPIASILRRLQEESKEKPLPPKKAAQLVVEEAAKSPTIKTIAAIDTSKVGGIAAAINKLGKDLQDPDVPVWDTHRVIWKSKTFTPTRPMGDQTDIVDMALRLQNYDSPRFTEVSILDWPTFMQGLKEGLREAENPRISPEWKRVIQILSPESREILRGYSQDEELDVEKKSLLIRDFNDLLERRDLYDEVTFKETPPGEEARELIQKRRESRLSQHGAQRLNRLLFARLFLAYLVPGLEETSSVAFPLTWASISDWPALLSRLKEAVKEVEHPKTPLPKQRVASMLGEESKGVIRFYAKGDLPESRKEILLNDLNALLEKKELYDGVTFQSIGKESRALLEKAEEYPLSQEETQRLNRLLLESILGKEIARCPNPDTFNSAVLGDARRLGEAAEEAVIAEYHAPGVERVHGISVYAVAQSRAYNPMKGTNPITGLAETTGRFSYESLQFAKDAPEWVNLMKKKFKNVG